jgi:hypothetical protein
MRNDGFPIRELRLTSTGIKLCSTNDQNFHAYLEMS